MQYAGPALAPCCLLVGGPCELLLRAIYPVTRCFSAAHADMCSQVAQAACAVHKSSVRACFNTWNSREAALACSWQVLRKIASVDAAALRPAYDALVPLVCGLVQGTSGPTRIAAEATLARVLRLDDGLATAQEWLASGTAGGTAVSVLTEPTLRRLSRLTVADEDA